jgi:hypothetical protein
MERLKRCPAIVLAMACIAVAVHPCFSSENQKPLTVAESSNYTETSKHADVLRFIEELQTLTPLLRVEHLCTSTEGKYVPLLIIGNPVPASPLDLNADDRMVVYIQANIHAGEVEGKEACLMLVRDILLQENPPYLNNLVLLIAPIFNADGNDKFGKNRRDNGPELAGIRYNGQNLDLNRDAIKMESPELQGMITNVLNRWDPVLLVDCHTTNGSYHEEPVTYAWGFNPNGSPEIIEYMRKSFMPSVQKNMEKKYNVLSIPYGNFMDAANPEKGWTTAGPEGRYITNYIGLRNRLSILNENYAYADFKTRVWGCYYFLSSILEYCEAKKEEILRLLSEADRKTIDRGLRPSETDVFHVEYDLQAYDEKLTIRSWEMEVTQQEGARPRVRRTDKKKTYSVPYFCKFIPKRSVKFPSGYFISVNDPSITEKLNQHGVTVERLKKEVTVEVESFQVSEIKSDERAYQGHHLNSIKGGYKTEEMTFPTGTLFVGTAQRLGSLASYLLEPESDDGLFVWNFFDRYLVAQWGSRIQTTPVYRLLKPVTLVKETIR